ACNGDITLEVASDRPVPSAIDSICVGVADTSARGGQFGRDYALTGKLASLPQTLRVDPGGVASATVWVRGDRGGVPAALAATRTDFGGDVTLSLDACVKGPAALPQAMGAPVGPGGALLAASEGAGGNVVLAIGASGAALIDARSGALVTADLPPLPVGKPVALVTADLDGDCDDDAIIATDGAAPEIWLRDHATFTDAGPIGNSTVAAIATADVDRDGAVDVIMGGGGTLQLWRNDGGGSFTLDPAALDGGAATAISAIAAGDLDGDGNADLVVGQSPGTLLAWLGDPGGTGSFAATDGVVPAESLDVERLTLADADGDFDPDLGIAVRGAPWKLLVDRDGVLEDQSFVRLPQPVPTVHAIAFGGWDDGCEPDAVVASDSGAPTLHGQPGGAFAAEMDQPPAATDVVMVDLDDDGALDAVLATPNGVVWLAR
ncbi:MAG TPA: VCBS repeat-containing protein, partial [Kofleriaceae bacterium]|nr:VCBS repeat-containing protein [Kofleriaceae bacterium]